MSTGRRLATLLVGLTLSLGGLALGPAAQAAPGPGHEISPAAAGNFYQVVNKHSNKCVTPRGNSTGLNALVVQRSCENRVSHRWAPEYVGNGYYWLVNQGSGLCLDLQANSEEEVQIGTLVQQFACRVEYTSEQWELVPGPAPSGHYQLRNRVKGLCADVKFRSTANDAQLQVIECKYNEPAQLFRFA